MFNWPIASSIKFKDLKKDFDAEKVDIILLKMVVKIYYNVLQFTSQLNNLKQIESTYCQNHGFLHNIYNTIVHFINIK